MSLDNYLCDLGLVFINKRLPGGAPFHFARLYWVPLDYSNRKLKIINYISTRTYTLIDIMYTKRYESRIPVLMLLIGLPIGTGYLGAMVLPATNYLAVD